MHSAAWWRWHWERTGIVAVEVAETMPDGWRLWLIGSTPSAPTTPRRSGRLKRIKVGPWDTSVSLVAARGRQSWRNTAGRARCGRFPSSTRRNLCSAAKNNNDQASWRAETLSSVGWSLAVVLGIVVLAALVLVPHNLRVRRVRRVYRSLPAEVVDRVLQLIERAAASGPSVTFLRLAEEAACDGAVLVQSHVGGVPYAESGDEWPQGTPEGEPAKFMLQVRLDHPALGDQWQGRLIVVFLVFDAEQVVRSYAAPCVEKYVPLDAKWPPRPCIRLQPVRMPAEGGEEGKLPLLPDRLCDDFPEITVPLEPYTNDFAGVLAQILRPILYGYDLDAPRIAYVGGDPMLIQNPHDPVCDECGKPMRFLFQFGEVVPGVQMADDGVCYVYGCDDHPDRCKGFVDSH